MPPTNDSSPTDPSGHTQPGKTGSDHSDASEKANQSNYAAATAVVSPPPLNQPQRWDRFVLLNIVAPILLIAAGWLIVVVLGEAKAEPLPPRDTSPAAVLESLPATRVEQIQSLEETGRSLELIIDGTVVPHHEALVASEVAGRVIEKSPNCEAGSIVRKGEVLMKIDPAEYKLELRRLTKLKEQELKSVEEVAQEIENTQRSIEVAQQDVELKQKEIDRQKRLQSFASEAEVDQAQSAFLQSRQTLVNLRNQQALLKKRSAKLDASVELVDAQLELAQLNVARCTVSAPISGVIVSEQADVNSFVNRGNTLITIEDTAKVEVAANMRMDQLHWVLDQRDEVPKSKNAKGRYDLPDTEAIIEYEVAGRKAAVQRWRGTLVSYDGIGIDPQTRTVPVRLVVDHPAQLINECGDVQSPDRANALVRGMFVRVRLQLKPQSDLVVIPARALRPGNKVWMFQPSQQVLEEQIALAEKQAEEAAKNIEESSEAPAESTQAPEEPAEAAPPETMAENDPATDGEQEDSFDPSAWQAGLVMTSSSVYPIESLSLDNSREDRHQDLAPSLQTPRRSWVCQAEGDELKSGQWVVVSPLDTIPTEGLPARAEIAQ